MMEINMIKRLATAVLVLVLFTGTSYAAEINIGVIDVRTIVASTPQRESIALTLQTEFKERGESLKAMEDEIKKMEEQRRNDAPTMSAQQMTDLVRNMESKVATYELDKKALQEDYKRRNEEEQRKLLALTKKAIDQVAANEGLQLILQSESIAYVAPKLDVTNKVIALMSEPNFK